ncbi:F-box/kelch-repeat protein At3g06240-like, partial [Rutidosis leptorrhynchoides]|uniref:F-box/kelch-repeat protein At3g06240-like n=1 Tax=Rutidosis leptorrhynchoides TaxID=125765 RepID=UPI003A9948A1
MSDPHDPMCALNRLPPDLIEAILLFLPPKSLGRFKSVSKRWYSLISSHRFIKIHIQKFSKNNPNSEPTNLILLSRDFTHSISLKQPLNFHTPATVTAKHLKFLDQWVDILGSCNGLVLGSDIHDNLCFVNPTTRKTLKVSGGETFGTYGFGYDSSTDDYKVIFIPVKFKFARVYSFRRHSWNMLPNFPYQQDDYFCKRGQGVLLNNNLYWLVIRSYSKMTIIAFNLANEEFHEIELPDSFRCSQIFAVDGKLAAVVPK